jgi:hypothetical protein
MPAKVRGGRFSTYTSYVIEGGGRIRMVNADIQSVPAGFYTSQWAIHASDRVYNSVWDLTLSSCDW